MDEDERYTLGEFADAAVAGAHRDRIVDEYLASAFTPGDWATGLWSAYTSFAEDPFIRSVDAPQVSHFAWGYAKERCLPCSPASMSESDTVPIPPF